MAQPTITISAPRGNTPIPCQASGTASPSPGKTLTGMSCQIDSGPLIPIQNYNPNGGNWSCALTQMDCPVVGKTYLLTVYAGDSSGNFNHATSTFTRTP